MNYEIINRYVNELIDKSAPGKPYWNIEVIRAGKPCKWNYIDGCMTNSLIELYKLTGDKKIYDFVKAYIDYFVNEDGTINTYEKEKHSTDDIAEGRTLFSLYDISGEEKYRKAIENIYAQIKEQPRTPEGNFWHKEIYPNQIWLDGLYMAQPFYLTYETRFNKMENYNDIIGQIKNVRKYMFDEKKKLYYHGYDASKKMFWADPKTGLSKNFWLRSIGWFTVALADCAEIINQQMYDEFRTITTLLKEIIDSLLTYQDPKTKMFYQVVDKGDMKGNYVETSGSAMIAYSILKGVRMGILPERYQKIGLDIFDGICENMLKENNGSLDLEGICLVAGLGPDKDRRRDGSYEYYISEPVVANDAKGVGAFTMAYIEVLRILKSQE
ncbi:MAG: glycoside hydrolase family 88 protein [Acholeplasmatales bacterium]|nr:glycoside hydrolase family 88 protein [Acholeplasmatales bacterium]